MSCSCVIDKLYPCVQFKDGYFEKIEDISMSCYGALYGPDIRSNAVEENKSSEIPCERCIHSYICKYKEDFEKAWKKLGSAIACTKCVKGVL